jgi:hypothetical protein
LATSSTTVRTVTFLDELNSFNGVDFRNNPVVSFEVSAVTPSLGVGAFDQSAPLRRLLGV